MLVWLNIYHLHPCNLVQWGKGQSPSHHPRITCIKGNPSVNKKSYDTWQQRHKRHFVEKRAVLCGVQHTTRVGRNVNSDLASQSTNKTPSIHDSWAETQTSCDKLMQKCNHCQLHLTLSSWRGRLKMSSAPQMLFVTPHRYVHEGHSSTTFKLKTAGQCNQVVSIRLSAWHTCKCNFSSENPLLIYSKSV